MELNQLQNIVNKIPLEVNSLQEALAEINKKLEGFDDLSTDLITLQHIIQTIQTDLAEIQTSTPKQSDVQNIRESLTSLTTQANKDISETTITCLQKAIITLSITQELEKIKNVISDIQIILEATDRENINNVKFQLQNL